MSHPHDGENNELVDQDTATKEETSQEVTEEQTAEDATQPDAVSEEEIALREALARPLQLAEIPIAFGIDGKQYKIKSDLNEEDVSSKGITRLHKLYMLLIFGMNPQFNMDVKFYLEENDLMCLLVEVPMPEQPTTETSQEDSEQEQK